MSVMVSTNDIVLDYKRVNDGVRDWLTYKNIDEGKDRMTLAKEDISIIFPTVYTTKNGGILANITSDVHMICIFAIINHSRKEYAVSLATCRHTFNVMEMMNITIDGHDFKELKYNAGDVILASEYTTIDDDCIFILFDLFFIQGKIPWFLSYTDVASLLSTTRKFSGSSLGDNPIGPHVLTSLIGRYSKDPNIYYRELLNTESDFKKLGRPSYKGLKDPLYSFNTTTARLVGSYLEEGMVASMLKPTRKEHANDEILTR